MFKWLKIYYCLLNLLLKILVKIESIPKKPILELKLDISRPIIYILSHNSKLKLLILRAQSLFHNLPDPLEPLIISDTQQFPRYFFIYSKTGIFSNNLSKEQSIKSICDYFNIYCNNKYYLDVQIVPVFIMFGRYDRYQRTNTNLFLYIFNNLHKLLTTTWFDRSSSVHFSPPISLQWIKEKSISDKIIIHKLIRIVTIHFIRQHLVAIGPCLSNRKQLFKKLLQSQSISCAIQDQAHNQNISYEQARQNAIAFMYEITANFSDKMVIITDFILGIIWHRLYQDINVYNIEYIRQLAYHGYKIIYIPCHRSHMDYLLLSYVLYHYGLAPPHIAAGVNLNFWPAGSIFRCLGAFFIRRTFKINKLYSTVLREYLNELFNCGYSIEYFIEGKRSRTGRLIDPKTGILSMTIQSMLRGNIHPIMLVPVYIGYEHIIELNSYIKEISGVKKKKENLMQVIYGLSKLRNLGYGHVNFGEPLLLITWLNQHVPEWRQSIKINKIIHPSWLTPVVNNIATDLMVRINKASVAHAINLCCTVLLSSSQNKITIEQLKIQLKCYLDLMRNVLYAKNIVLPLVTINKLINHAIQMDKIKMEYHTVSNSMMILYNSKKVSITYYRNNIIHMLVLPSLIATVIIQYRFLCRNNLLLYIRILYPMIKTELFLHWNNCELIIELNKLINELLRQELIMFKGNHLMINPLHINTLQLLASNIKEILYRYTIIFWLLYTHTYIHRDEMEAKSYKLAQYLSSLYDVSLIEYFDKKTLNTLLITLRAEGYINSNGSTESQKITQTYQILSKLVPSDIRCIIEETINH